MAAGQRILIGGASGLIGQLLSSRLHEAGYEVKHLVRPNSHARTDGIAWQPAVGELDPADVEGFHAWIHLGGENIAEGRWTPEKKKRIRDSRVDSTTLLAKTALGLKKPPAAFLCASAIGFYGDRGDTVLTENSEKGQGFLPDLGEEWEQAAEPFDSINVRRVHLRLGIVLSDQGGALAKMLPPFKLGLGGPIGSGQQYMSWIHIDDAVAAIIYCLEHETLTGPVNLVSPNPETNAAFSKKLGAMLRRPSFLPLPKFAVNAMFGEMGQNLLLEGSRVVPERLLSTGFNFQHPELGPALRHLLMPSKEKRN